MALSAPSRNWLRIVEVHWLGAPETIDSNAGIVAELGSSDTRAQVSRGIHQPGEISTHDFPSEPLREVRRFLEVAPGLGEREEGFPGLVEVIVSVEDGHVHWTSPFLG
jgi:hypothetical protein